MSKRDASTIRDQLFALEYFDDEETPLLPSVYDKYEQLKHNHEFLREFKVYNSLSPRRANVFSLVFSILPWEEKEFEDLKYVREIISDFSRTIKLKVEQIEFGVGAELKDSFSKRSFSTSDHPFQFCGNITGQGKAFHLWFLVGDFYPLSINAMIIEAKTILKAWRDVTSKHSFFGLASVSFGDLFISQTSSLTEGRFRIGQAFNESARLVWEILLKHQKDLARNRSSLVVCNRHASVLLFDSWIGRQFENNGVEQSLRIAL